jgi:endonuclease/exonuclease/phosphatase family metal-dependent hydrolase
MELHMKIMSFNTQHCLGYIEKKIDFELMARTIVESGADIIGLNEMRGAGEVTDYTDQTGKLSELTGIENYYFAKAIDVGGKNAPYGNALLSKYPIESAETILVPDPTPRMANGRYYETRCLLKAKLSCGITVLVIHFGLNQDEQMNAVETVIKNMESERCILMGDFNVLPDNSVLLPIRERMTDAASLFDGEKLSFPSDKPDRKIDYIFVTPDLKLVAADIPATVASDHRPHTAEIDA